MTFGPKYPEYSSIEFAFCRFESRKVDKKQTYMKTEAYKL